jgi:hypothetical protein
LVAVIALIVGIATEQVMAKDEGVTVTIWGFPTTNGVLVEPPKVCPGPPPYGDCQWQKTFLATVNAGDGIKEVEVTVSDKPIGFQTSPALTSCDNPTKQVNVTFTCPFAVKCPSEPCQENQEDFKIKVWAKDCDKYEAETHSEEKTLRLICKRPHEGEKKTAVYTNGTTTVEALPNDQDVLVQFVVLNVDEDSNLINLTVDNPLGWDINPPIPLDVVLGPGESIDFLVDVTVPGGTSAGTVAEIILSAQIHDVPESESSDAVTVVVHWPSATSHTQWGLILLILVVAGFFGFMIMRRRRAMGYAR